MLAELGVLALLLLGFGAARRARGTGWRALVLAGLWVALANPSAVREQRQPLDDVAVVVIDQSRSQSIGDRAEQARAAGEEMAQSLRGLSGLEVRTVTVDHDSSGEGTRLFSALNNQLADVPPERVAGAVVITDGQIHDAPEVEQDLAEATPGPLHVLLTGAPGRTRPPGGDRQRAELRHCRRRSDHRGARRRRRGSRAPRRRS